MAVSTMFFSWSLPSSRLLKTPSRPSIKGILYPPLTHVNANANANINTFYIKSACNVQIVVSDDEPEDRIVNRFRKEVLKAGVLQECRRRRFFEDKRDKIKRKAREASRRNRKRKSWSQNKRHSENKKIDVFDDDDSDIDHWELPGVDIPYT